MDATRERHVTPLNSEEGKIFLSVILPIAYSQLYRESGPNKMAPLASILLEREQEVARSSLFFEIPSVSLSKRVLVRNFCYGNLFQF